MVKSLAGKYKDIVAIYPKAKLTAAKQFQCYTEVVALIRNVSFNFVAICVDNATTNRKFFIDFLCLGQMKTCIVDSVSGQTIFLLFDPVHNIKNIYNNFQSRKLFECPSSDRHLPEGCKALFQDIVDLYNMESVMSLKKAHKLNPSTLAPRSIEKTSVKLAMSVFCESTRDALQFYADIKKGKLLGMERLHSFPIF